MLLGATLAICSSPVRVCYRSCSEGCALTPLTLIICGCSWFQTSVCSPVGTLLCLLFPLPIFYSFLTDGFGNNLPGFSQMQKTCCSSRSCSHSYPAFCSEENPLKCSLERQISSQAFSSHIFIPLLPSPTFPHEHSSYTWIRPHSIVVVFLFFIC